LKNDIVFLCKDDDQIQYFKELLYAPIESDDDFDNIAMLHSLKNSNFFYEAEKFLEHISRSQPSCILIQNINNDPAAQKVYKLLRTDVNFTDTPIIILALRKSKKEKSAITDEPFFENDNNLTYIQYPVRKEQLILQIDKIVTGRNYILLADDSKMIHKLLGEFLVVNNFRLISAFNGREALLMLRKFKPDLIISDVEMPEMNGYEFCKAVKNNTQLEKIPVMILSALGSGLDVDRGFEAGANDYLTKPVDNDELLSRLQNLLQKTNRSTREKILIVDDSNIVSTMLSQGLEQQGFKVFTAVNGKEGLIKALEIMPDLITSDYDMPVMNGWEFCSALRKDKILKDIPVIMLTSRDSTADRAKSTGAGVKSYLTKPFTIDKLLAVIERILAEKRMEREREILKFYVSDVALESARLYSQNQGSMNNMRAKEIYATVLFSDIAQFTTTCEKLNPLDLINLLNEYFDVMCSVLKKNNAIIDKFIGDAIMAIFPDKGNGSYNAVKSGCEMTEALKEFNKNRETPLHMRIGINYGKLYIGDIGSKAHRRDFTVIGDTVNIGQRLESNSKVDGVLISESTYENVKDFVDAIKVGPLSLKGKVGEHYAYDVLSIQEKISF